jgi:hypothetical protein
LSKLVMSGRFIEVISNYLMLISSCGETPLSTYFVHHHKTVRFLLSFSSWESRNTSIKITLNIIFGYKM